MAAPRYVTLDHWRGVACLFVLVNHAVWYRTGTQAEIALANVAQRLWLGVPIFFVISGYCIAQACGVVCYSLYLVHLPISNLLAAGSLWIGFRLGPFASVLVTVPTCLYIARWFHLVVERRFLNRPAAADLSSGFDTVALRPA